MSGDMGRRAMEGLWPAHPLARHYVVAPSICHLSVLSQELTTEDHVFVADEAFPLRKKLMRPFPGRTLPRERRVFNYRLSRARLVVKNAFGILSSQWRMYRRLIEVQPDVVERCVKATCVLHNFMRRSAETTSRLF